MRALVVSFLLIGTAAAAPAPRPTYRQVRAARATFRQLVEQDPKVRAIYHHELAATKPRAAMLLKGILGFTAGSAIAHALVGGSATPTLVGVFTMTASSLLFLRGSPKKATRETVMRMQEQRTLSPSVLHRLRVLAE